ncbi:MAG TPA: type I DNA topoisomerase [Acidimicrobiia bacterium]|jgi:DNA topoisomerase-1|nr:type I DNA topoisomerase [Acidimicrobiia bacterium]
MPKALVIVESPTKARTISSFLENAVVESSMGHIRDLPRSAAEIPASAKGSEWARLGVDVENDFKPLYVVPKDRSQQVKKLKKALEEADVLYLATDEDREGEAIAWHLVEVLKPKVPVRRMVFHEITKPAIEEAFANPRDLDERLVQAQEARRILDRLYGYEVSPVLWRKVQPRLSAGRVQSVAVRIVVERERERMAFVPADYWGIEGVFARADDLDRTFTANLLSVDDARVATGRDFDEQGKAKEGVLILDRDTAEALATGLADASFQVRSVTTKPYKRSPQPPFRTSTLQQEAGRKLRFSSSRTMSVAQRLYENGYITYMRTDSVNLSETAVAAARSQVAKIYGEQYLSPSPRRYASKVKGAQEAHEAIRPAGESFKTPEQVAREVGPDEAKLYDLIWRRTMASQMADAVGVTVTARIGAVADDGRDTVWGASGRTITFPGFLAAYVQGRDEEDADDEEGVLPPLEEGVDLAVQRLEPTGHTTKPPARYTEASLVQRLEELGVGRPSTYASIMTTIQDRGYVFKKGTALVPSFTAFAVVTLLERHFPQLVDYDFTAAMEADLDSIAAGEQESVPWLSSFYFGDDGLRETIARRLDEIDPREVGTISIGKDADGNEVVARVGRYGPYVERGEERASIPDDLPPDELTVEKAVELIETQNAGAKIFGTDPESGLTVYGMTGRFGPYVQLGEQEEGSKEKPKRASLLRGWDLDEMGLDDALRLLSLPRVIGHDEDGVEILALNGRYGPYIQRGEDRRSLESEDQLFTITVEEALQLLAEPPRRRGQARTSVLADLGEDPGSGKKITVRNGRFGPYVTDGEVNASLRKGDDPSKMTLDRALELLAARRERLASG